MNAAEKIAHAAERKAFEAMLDSLIRKSQTKDVCTVANDFVNMVQKIHSSVWTPEAFEMLHQIANDPDSNGRTTPSACCASATPTFSGPS